MLKITNLKQTYFYGTTAIKGLDLEVADGEKIAILTKSGGGKTSLLKCIAGLFPADEGSSIVLDGKDITKEKIKNRDVRLIYDDGGLIRKRSVKYNLEYPLKIRKIPKNERREIVDNICREYDLLPFCKEIAYRLFEPQIVTLALARASLRESKLTLIDDIFSLLKGEERRLLFNQLLPKMRSISGITIFATDSLEEAFSFADRVVVFNAGYHLQTGTPFELLTNPNCLFVDNYVNPYKSTLCVGVVDGYVTIDDVKIKLPEDYDSDEAIITYYVKESVTGDDFVPSIKRYVGNGLYCYQNEAGDSLISNDIKSDTKVSIDKSSIRVYHRINEKLLTTSIVE
ncbi:MAG: ATP-binding cassette domain-containing protein [Clostridia bacterium]|nr:ATP-binding cassette domain-containing protein [Clostridia bacterium]